MRFLAATVLMIGVSIHVTSGDILAHHSFAGEFDDSIAVTLHGVIVSVEMINPHSFIYLDVKTPRGAVERWALEGPGSTHVLRRGLGEFIKPGDELGVCGYLARRDVVPTRTEPLTARAARKLQAAVLTMPDGQKLVWSNYRQRKCGLDT